MSSEGHNSDDSQRGDMSASGESRQAIPFASSSRTPLSPDMLRAVVRLVTAPSRARYKKRCGNIGIRRR
jgi:hypothetical protein